jgi:phospholipid/cholesterol/gamma-HCH transport system permease protein
VSTTAPGRGRRGFARDPLAPLEQAGEQLVFWWLVLRYIPVTIRSYGKQIGMIVSDLSLGTGVFIIGGGVVGVTILLSTLTGSEVGFEGHNGLSVIGLAPLTGFVSAYLNTREMAPIVASLGFAARIGCGFTSRLGAMRISEEIDALESMAIRPVPYLVTTRLLAGTVLVIPLYLICLVGTYVATDLMVTVFFGQSHGTYQHYFQAFVAPIDVLYSAIKVVVLTSVVTLIHCYYGFTATGGPEGVGRATGRAIRTSIIAITILDITMTLTLWGVNQQAVISG